MLFDLVQVVRHRRLQFCSVVQLGSTLDTCQWDANYTSEGLLRAESVLRPIYSLL